MSFCKLPGDKTPAGDDFIISFSPIRGHAEDQRYTFRGGITAHLNCSGKLNIAHHIANHQPPRTGKLYDRRPVEISLAELERIAICGSWSYTGLRGK